MVLVASSYTVPRTVSIRYFFFQSSFHTVHRLKNTMAALDIKSSEADELLVKATKAAVKKSGAKFFKTIQKRSTDFIELATRNSYSPENFKEIEDVLTFENLILLARFYAGEITKAKRKRKGVETLHDKVTKLMSDNRQRIILDVILIHYALNTAMVDCETRAAYADA